MGCDVLRTSCWTDPGTKLIGSSNILVMPWQCSRLEQNPHTAKISEVMNVYLENTKIIHSDFLLSSGSVSTINEVEISCA